MSLEKMETSELVIRDPESYNYSWDFKIPPVSIVRKNLGELHGGKGFVFKDLKFNTGVLANITHHFIFAIYANQVNVYLSLPSRNFQRRYDVRKTGKLELCSNKVVQHTSELKFTCEDMANFPTDPQCMFSAIWLNKDDVWTDDIDLMRLYFTVDYVQTGTIIPRPVQDISDKLNLHISPLELNAIDLFLSEELSDVVLVCGSNEYHAHRFLLASKSPVFRRMFQNDMQESNSGKIVLADMSPEVVVEMLRFLYCGSYQGDSDICKELFIVAEKYNIETLKSRSESSLLGYITPENALDMYFLGETYNGKVLMDVAIEEIRKNKTKIAADAEMFKEFTIRYPQLMFQLYKM